MIYLSPKVGFLESFCAFCTIKKQTSCKIKKLPSTKNKKPSTEKQEIPSTVGTAFMCLYRSKYVQDSLTVVEAGTADLGLLETVFS